jgi:diaminopimelate epimerase
MKTVPFIKMHGAGNDFVIVECRSEDPRLTSFDIKEICDRHKGIGCDQLVLLKASKLASVRVEFYNGDGSESGACGNATRCVASLIMMQNEVDTATIETKNGRILECYNTGEVLDSGEELYTVNMGTAKYDWQDIPLEKEMDTLLLPLPLPDGLGGNSLKDSDAVPIILAQRQGEYSLPSAVNIGNPHCVYFVDNVGTAAVHEHGFYIENHPLFPQRTNVEFVQVISRGEIKLRVWERGSGETLACGSGACAAVAAGVRRQLLSNKVKVHLPGGDLHIEIIENGDIMMTGPVMIVFTGVIEL